MKKTIRTALIALFITCILTELITQGIYFLPAENNLHIFIQESYRRTFSNLRIYNEFFEILDCRRIKLPPPIKKDILVVGDSFPFGAFVKSKDCFPSLIQSSLHKDVVNLGVPGTFPFFYNRMVEVGMRYDPELIVYCIYANDFIDSLLSEKDKGSIIPGDHGLDDQLFIDTLRFTHKAARIRKSMFNQLKSWQVLKRLMDFFVFWRIGLLKDLQPVDFEGHITYCHPRFWHSALNLQNNTISYFFNKTIAHVKHAHHFVAEQGKPFFVVLIPCKEMVCGTLTEAFSGQQLRTTYTVLEKRLREEGIPVFNLTDLFIQKEAEKKNESLFLRTDVHLTEAGHNAAAEGIVQFIQKGSF